MSNENKNTNRGYGDQLIQGLAPAIKLQEFGRMFSVTTQKLAVMINEEISGTFNLPELDNIILTPRTARNQVGATEIIATAYFDTRDPNGNIFYRGKGKNNRAEGGRINMVSTAGIAGGGTGPFGTTEHFNQVIKPLCKIGDNGKPRLQLKSVQGNNQLASCELDFGNLMMLALGIKPGDPYDYDIMAVVPVPQSNNFTIFINKYIDTNGVRKGRNTQVNYSRYEQELFNRINNNNRGGNRDY